MRRTGLLLTLCFVIPLTLVGCSDYEELSNNVIINNQRVEMVTDSYETSKKVSIDLEPVVIEAILSKDIAKSGDNPTLENLKIDKGDFTSTVEGLSDYFNTFIELNNHRSEDTDTPDYARPDKIEDIENFLNETLEVNYFLNDKNGKVEQVFKLELPNGQICGVIFTWVGGVYLDSKTFGFN